MFYSIKKKYKNIYIKFQKYENNIINLNETKNIRNVEIVLGKKINR